MNEGGDGAEKKQILGGERGREWAFTLVYVTVAMGADVSCPYP